MIRPVKLQDAVAISRIYNHYVEKTTVSFETEPLTEFGMARRIASIASHYPYFVHEDCDGGITGYCYVHQWKERAAYDGAVETTIYLKAGSEACGIGTMLMERLIDECRARGYRVLIACVTAENAASVAFHKKLGFEQVSHFKNVGCKFGRLLDVVDLQYTL